eukprot:2119434-Amphidinium_carterae.4
MLSQPVSRKMSLQKPLEFNACPSEAVTETLLQNAAKVSRESRKREIKMEYRGKEIKLEVESLRGELTKRTACMIKSLGHGIGQ